MRADVPAGPPSIGPAPGSPDRPFWSVMIPTYNASGLLEEALRSVLDQDPGRDSMQIAVVDDCSPDEEARRIVERLAPGRVEFHRGAANVGLAGNWNACLGLSRGRWVHLLHQDDLVLPGFYERMGRADADPSVGMAFCQHAFIDDQGAWTSISRLERRGAGVLAGWLGLISRGQRIQCPSVVVRRSVYENLGGFRADLRFVLDWEMWVRIATRFATWFEPKVLACYRMHEGSETERLRKVAADLDDFHGAFEQVAAHLPAELRGTVGVDSIEYMTNQGLGMASGRLVEGDYRGGMAQLRAVIRFNPGLRFSRVAFDYRKWAMKLWLLDQRKRLAGLGARAPASRERIAPAVHPSTMAAVAGGNGEPGGVDHHG